MVAHSSGKRHKRKSLSLLNAGMRDNYTFWIAPKCHFSFFPFKTYNGPFFFLPGLLWTFSWDLLDELISPGSPVTMYRKLFMFGKGGYGRVYSAVSLADKKRVTCLLPWDIFIYKVNERVIDFIRTTIGRYKEDGVWDREREESFPMGDIVSAPVWPS